MILSVTLNPCIDKSSKVEKIKPDSKLRCSEVVNEPGGGGINVSKALQKLETPSVALFPAGGHNGNMLCSLLKEQSILFHAVDTKVETRENWVVLEESLNNQYRFTFPGKAVQEETIITLIDHIRSFSPSYVVASGSLPPGLPDHFYGLIVKTAKSVGAKTIVDTSGAALQALKNKGAYLIKPNISELCKMLEVDHLEKDEIVTACRQAINDGYAELIAVSMGAEGAWLISEEESYYAAAPDVPKKSTVGAGDSMVAGMTYMLQQNRSINEVISFGVACGSAATMNEGTQLFKREDAMHLYELIRNNETKA
ncbi:MAG: 1-phosphofructokinase family hexose kinase [Sphingobacteriales bacterium]|nr:MAG: 1-phosphofructokinase family hexose kinase [Sphingobacteriales bacterium]